MNMMAQGAIVAGSNIAFKILYTYGDRKLATISASTIAAGGTLVNGILYVKGQSDVKKLRAYYGH